MLESFCLMQAKTRTRGVAIDFSANCAWCYKRMHGGNRVEVAETLEDKSVYRQYFHFMCYSAWKAKASA